MRSGILNEREQPRVLQSGRPVPDPAQVFMGKSHGTVTPQLAVGMNGQRRYYSESVVSRLLPWKLPETPLLLDRRGAETLRMPRILLRRASLSAAKARNDTTLLWRTIPALGRRPDEVSAAPAQNDQVVARLSQVGPGLRGLGGGEPYGRG